MQLLPQLGDKKHSSTAGILAQETEASETKLRYNVNRLCKYTAAAAAAVGLCFQGCFPWWADKKEIVTKKAQGKEINGKSNNLNNW